MFDNAHSLRKSIQVVALSVLISLFVSIIKIVAFQFSSGFNPDSSICSSTIPSECNPPWENPLISVSLIIPVSRLPTDPKTMPEPWTGSAHSAFVLARPEATRNVINVGAIPYVVNKSKFRSVSRRNGTLLTAIVIWIAVRYCVTWYNHRSSGSNTSVTTKMPHTRIVEV